MRDSQLIQERWVTMFRQSEAISVSFAVLNDPTTDERVLYESKRIPSGSGALFESKDVAAGLHAAPDFRRRLLEFQGTGAAEHVFIFTLWARYRRHLC